MASPFVLPGGNVQVCFSGGRTSAFLLHSILEANGGLPDRARVVFTNTGAEHPATLDFVAEVAARWSVRVDWVEYRAPEGKRPTFEVVSHNSASRDFLPFREAIRRKRAVPNIAQKFCTIELKIRTAKRFLVAQGWDRWTSALGIRADESDRLAGVTSFGGRSLRVPYVERAAGWLPLVDAGVTRRDVLSFWCRQPFDLALASGRNQTPLGNCVGCFLKSEATLAALWRDVPDLMEPFRAVEVETGRQFNKAFSHAQLADYVDRQGAWVFNDRSFLCQASHGECAPY